MKIHPMLYAGSLLFMGFAGLAIAMFIDRHLYDWPAIRADLARLEVLEQKAHIYETMTEMNVGIWCELAVHYDWIESEDHIAAQVIIDKGVHDD